MASRLLPLSLALAALLADGAGLHTAAFYLVLLAVPGAAAVAFIAVGDAFEARSARSRAAWTTLALFLLVTASAVRENAPHGSAVPVLATSALLAAVVAYGLSLVGWLLEPLRVLPRLLPARVRTEP